MRISLLQVSVLLVVSGLTVVMDREFALALLVGGLCSIVPQLYLSYYAFRHMGASRANEAARQMYRGEIGKFVLTLVFLAAAFALFPEVSVIGLIVGYLLMWLIHIIAAVRLLANHQY